MVVDHVRKSYVGESLYPLAYPGYRWHYLNRQTKDEVLMFKTYDSSESAPARCEDSVLILTPDSGVERTQADSAQQVVPIHPLFWQARQPMPNRVRRLKSEVLFLRMIELNGYAMGIDERRILQGFRCKLSRWV